MHKKGGPLRIRFTYEQAPQAQLHIAHGVWGGINQQGEIEMSFYHESDALPRYTEHIVAPDGSLGHEIVPDEDGVRTVCRHIHSRVLLSYETARAVHEWLDERLSQMEEEEMPGLIPPDRDREQ